MINFNMELEKMVANKNLMNSYKLYFLKTLILNVFKDKREFSFYEMACWMCAYSFSDVCKLGNRIRPLDRLYDIAVFIIESEGLMESSEAQEVYDLVYYSENKELIRIIKSLCNYVPYRLLAYLWPYELSGKNDKQKNEIIEELSRSELRCIYSISPKLKEKKVIEVNFEWTIFIENNRRKLASWIDKKIDVFVRKG